MLQPIGKNIRALRRLHGVTQTKLAAQVGVAPAYISQIESMIRVPSVRVTHKIAEALGTTVGMLLGEGGEDAAAARLSKMEQIHMLKRLVIELEAELENEDANGAEAGGRSQSTGA